LEKKREINYEKTLQISMILSLLILIALFYFFPRFRETIVQPTYYRHTIEIISIPPTSQRTPRQPRPLKPVIPVAEEEPEILRPVVIKAPTALTADGVETIEEFLTTLPEGFRPKQILEVIPENANFLYDGVIVLALKIGKKGMVIEHRLLKNTTGSGDCVQQALKAARASIWEPAIIDGQAVTYWIEKTYQFKREE
jgi:hypothetical protein